MARGPGQFYRHCSSETLTALFEAIGVTGVSFPAGTMKARAAQAEATALALDGVVRRALLVAVGEIEDLSNDLGVQCLLEAAGRRPEIVERFNAMRSDEERAAWMWVHRRRQFAEAHARRFFDSRGDSDFLSSAFEAPDDVQLSDDLRQLEGWFSGHFALDFGGMPRVKIERFQIEDSATLLSVHYEGLWATAPAFKPNGELSAEARAVVRHAAIKVEPSAVTIVTDRGGAARRVAISSAVAELALGLQGDLKRLPLVEYDLQRLLDPAPFATDPSHTISAVMVTRLEVSAPSLGAITKTYKSDGRAPVDVRDAVIKDLRATDRGVTTVSGADMRVVFGAGPGRTKSLSVKVKFSGEHSCHIGHTRHEDDLVRAHYLKRWGLLLAPRDRSAAR